MAKLILNPTSPARRDIPLPRSVLSIGRDPSNDLVLPDAMVSRRHAVIEFRASQYFLRDCNSSNGSLINGDRISERELRDGDLLAIGTVRLLYREEADLELGAKVVPHPSSPRLSCPACKADYRKGDVFCRQCGARVQEAPVRVTCTACGTAVLLPARFCNACGGALARTDSLEGTRPRAQPQDSASEGSEAPGGGPAAVLDDGIQAPDVSARSNADAEGAAVGVERPSPADGQHAPASHADLDALEHTEEVSRPPLAAPATPRGALRLAAVAPPNQAFLRARDKHAAPMLRPVPLMARPAPAAAPASVAVTDELRETVPSVGPRKPATPAARLAAAVADLALVACAGLLLVGPAAFVALRSRSADVGSPGFLSILWLVSAGVATLAIAAGYHILFWGLRGATPGKRWLGLAVEGLDGAFPIGLKRATLRLLGYALSGAALGLGFVVILFGATSVHDRLARTLVVRRAAP
jgi:uncharacterized RDD family membrane protein YckC